MKNIFFPDEKKEPIALVTYTHTNCKDVWPVYFGQLEEHLKGISSVAFSNEPPKDFENHKWIKYNDDDLYYTQYLSCLKEVNEDFIIYSQDDFFLYGDVHSDNLQKYVRELKNSDYSFVRLIRAGYSTPLNRHVREDMYEVNTNTSDAFSMQATLWKKDAIINLYNHVKSEKWLEGEHWNEGCRQLNVKGTFVYNQEEQRGKFHYDSLVFPYVCTGIVKGLWNTNEYPEVMSHLIEKYNVDTSIRGERTFYGQRGSKSTVWSVK